MRKNCDVCGGEFEARTPLARRSLTPEVAKLLAVNKRVG